MPKRPGKAKKAAGKPAAEQTPADEQPGKRVKHAAFGKLLKKWRIAAGCEQLKTAVDRLQEAGWEFDGDRPDSRPSVIAQMESGRISNPSVKNLETLAKAYGRSREEIIAALMADKYGLLPEGQNEEALQGVAEVISRALQAHIRNDVGIELLRTKNVLDRKGLAQWETALAGQSRRPIELWVVAPNFVDRDDADIFSAVVTILSAGAEVTYFVKAEDMRGMGQFNLFIDDLENYARTTDPSIKKGRVHAVGLEPGQLCWMAASFAISNPGSLTPANALDATGYTIIASDGTPTYGIRMSEKDLRSKVSEIRRFINDAQNAVATTVFFPSAKFTATLESNS